MGKGIDEHVTVVTVILGEEKGRKWLLPKCLNITVYVFNMFLNDIEHKSGFSFSKCPESGGEAVVVVGGMLASLQKSSCNQSDIRSNRSIYFLFCHSVMSIQVETTSLACGCE